MIFPTFNHSTSEAPTLLHTFLRLNHQKRGPLLITDIVFVSCFPAGAKCSILEAERPSSAPLEGTAVCMHDACSPFLCDQWIS
jgi:hypothetical protein